MHASSSQKKAQFKESSSVKVHQWVSCLAVVDVNNSFTHIHNPLLLLIHSSMDRKGHAHQLWAEKAQPIVAAHTQINGWQETCMQALVTLTLLLYNSTGQARDFVDQTQHVKNGFYFCMLTLVAWVNKTGQRSYRRTNNMLCQKTSSTHLKFDQLIVCVGCRKEIA